MSPYFPRRDLEANWCFLAGNMPSLWWFCRFSPCQLWAIDSLCWGRSLLSFSCLGVRMSHQSRSSCFSPGPLSSWSVVPCILFLSWSFSSLFLKLSLQVSGIFIMPSVPQDSFYVFHPFLFYGLFPQSYPTLPSTATEFFNMYIFISWESLWIFLKMHLLFSRKGSFIMCSTPSLTTSI